MCWAGRLSTAAKGTDHLLNETGRMNRAMHSDGIAVNRW
jgi:hypothetical protein